MGTRLGGRSEGIFQTRVVHELRTRRKIPSGGLQFTRVGVKRLEQIRRDDRFFRHILRFSFLAGFLFAAGRWLLVSLEKLLPPFE